MKNKLNFFEKQTMDFLEDYQENKKFYDRNDDYLVGMFYVNPIRLLFITIGFIFLYFKILKKIRNINKKLWGKKMSQFGKEFDKKLDKHITGDYGDI